MTAKIHDDHAALTNVGRVRPHNEDTVLAQPPLFVVADGLGGHEAGEVASSIAVETVRDHSPKHADAAALARAVRAANREVIRATTEGIGRTGMGTTMTAAIVEGRRAVLAHVGDSRAYLLHEGRLARVTEDHSMVADLIRTGQLTEAESRVHPNRSVITRALGTDADMEVDTYEIALDGGDRLLLCSDGLTSMLLDTRIEEILGQPEGAYDVAAELVAAANEAGGYDNISVIVIDIEGESEARLRERAKSRKRRTLAVFAWLLLFALVVSGVGWFTYSHAQRSYFLTETDGVVVIYRGVPGELAGRTLRWEFSRTTTPVEALPPSAQRRLADGVRVSSLEEALAKATEYQEMADPGSTGDPEVTDPPETAPTDPSSRE